MKIITFSDLHLSPIANHTKLFDFETLLVNSLNNDIKEKAIFIIIGDIFNQGNSDSISFISNYFKELFEKCEFDFEVIGVPGNHDLISKNKNPFHMFNIFMNNLRNDAKVFFSDDQNTIVYTIEDIDFILINSSYHENYKYGRVDIESLESSLKESKKDTKILVLHHHLIPTKNDNQSCTINSYEILLLAEKYNVTAILHGHQHMSLKIVLGKTKTNVIGVGSLFFDIGTNLNNQYNIIKIQKSIIEAFTYRYFQDEIVNGKLGGYRKQKILL